MAARSWHSQNLKLENSQREALELIAKLGRKPVFRDKGVANWGGAVVVCIDDVQHWYSIYTYIVASALTPRDEFLNY